MISEPLLKKERNTPKNRSFSKRSIILTTIATAFVGVAMFYFGLTSPNQRLDNKFLT